MPGADFAGPETSRLECEQCGEDYALAEQMCVVVGAENIYLGEHLITGQTICGGCVSRLQITGWRFESWGRFDGGYVQDPLGASQQPFSSYPRPPYRQTLEALAGRPRAPMRAALEPDFSHLLKSF
jgi:hypothetical protein